MLFGALRGVAMDRSHRRSSNSNVVYAFAGERVEAPARNMLKTARAGNLAARAFVLSDSNVKQRSFRGSSADKRRYRSGTRHRPYFLPAPGTPVVHLDTPPYKRGERSAGKRRGQAMPS